MYVLRITIRENEIYAFNLIAVLNRIARIVCLQIATITNETTRAIKNSKTVILLSRQAKLSSQLGAISQKRATQDPCPVKLDNKTVCFR